MWVLSYAMVLGMVIYLKVLLVEHIVIVRVNQSRQKSIFAVFLELELGLSYKRYFGTVQRDYRFWCDFLVDSVWYFSGT